MRGILGAALPPPAIFRPSRDGLGSAMKASTWTMTLSALDILAPAIRLARRIRAGGLRVAASLARKSLMETLQVPQFRPWIAGGAFLALASFAAVALYLPHLRVTPQVAQVERPVPHPVHATI